ncbi:MAG: BlaI/MecI/CopY family transcriptional regulator [Bryobacteraceae bacterium]
MRKAASREIPPPLELLCLSALWSLEQGSVKDVQQAVANARPLAYTTVMTVLDRLTRRGLITRRKTGRAFFYAPVVSRDTMRRLALKEFLDSFFESSRDQLLRFLQNDEPPAQPPAASAQLDPVLL